MSEPDTQWLVDLFEEHGTSLHRLVVMLGAESESGHILRAALIGLSRRAHRLVDPLERVEFLAEEVVHDARSIRGPLGALDLPELHDGRQQDIQIAIASMPTRLGEVLVVSHYLSLFGPELAGVMRMTVRSSNNRLEEALDRLRLDVEASGTVSSCATNDSLSQEVTAALRASARLVQPPGTETLEAELRSLNNSSSRGVALKVFLPLLAAAVGMGFWVAVATTPDAVVEAIPAATPTAAPMASASRSLPAQVRSVPVYYVGKKNMLLYRELRDLAATGNLLQSALEALFVVPPQDPDYSSLWDNARLLEVELIGHELTLNMSSASFENLTTPALAQAAVDQMVYTASELLGDPELRLVFLSDGLSPDMPLTSTDGFARRGLDPMPALWLTTPQNKMQLTTDQVVILGLVKPGATAPIVTIANDGGGVNEIVSSTTAQTATEANSAGWRAWSVSVALAPGSYVVTATTEVEGNAGSRTISENKSVTVS